MWKWSMTNKVLKFPTPISRMEEIISILNQYTPEEMIVIIKDAKTEQITFIVPPEMSIHEVSGRCMDVAQAVLLGMAED